MPYNDFSNQSVSTLKSKISKYLPGILIIFGVIGFTFLFYYTMGGVGLAAIPLLKKGKNQTVSQIQLSHINLTNLYSHNVFNIDQAEQFCNALQHNKNTSKLAIQFLKITKFLQSAELQGVSSKIYRKRLNVQQEPIGIERASNQVIIYDQTNSRCASLDDGNFACVSETIGYGGLPTNVVLEIFNSDGSFKLQNNLLISPNIVDTPITGVTNIQNIGGSNAQYGPIIAKTGNGKFIIVWIAPYNNAKSQKIVAKIYSNEGVLLVDQTGIFNDSLAPMLQRQQPYVVASQNDTSIIGWTSIGEVNADNSNVFGQRVNNTNLQLLSSAAGINLDNLSSISTEIKSLTQLGDDTFLLSRFAYSSPDGTCYGQQLDKFGNPIGNAFLLTNQTNPQKVTAIVAGLPGTTNQFLAVMDQNFPYGITLARFFDGPNIPSGNQIEKRVSTSITNTSTNPDVAVLKNSAEYGTSAMIVYQLFGPDSSSNGVFAQWIQKAANGSVELIGREFLVNWLNTNGNQQNPRIIQLTNGNIVISYESYNAATDPVSGLPIGFDIKHQVLTPRLDPFIYNADIPLTLDQKIPQNGTNFVLNPMVDADTVTVTLTPSEGIHLSAVNKSSYSYGNTTVVEDADTGEISISGHAVPVNLALNQLVVTPIDYFSGNASIAIHATDGGLHTDFNATVDVDVVPVDYKPDLTTATQVAIYQNTPFTLNRNLFNASNPDPNVNRLIAYDIGSALHITFYNTTSTPAVQVISFTDTELANGKIEVVPDDSGLSPEFTLQARDSETGLTSDIVTIDVTSVVMFTARPEFALGSFVINSDKVFLFTADNLKANSGVYPVGSSWQFSSIQNAKLINPKTDSALPVDGNGAVTVTQDDVVNGLVGIKPNGKSTSPAFNVAFGIPTNVVGQYLYSRANAAQINFNYVAKSNAALIGGVVGGVTGLLALTGLGVGIAACVKHKKKEQAILDAQAANRQAEPLANAVWEKLGSPEAYADFTSEAGLAFVGAVNHVLQKVDQQVSYKDNYAYFGEVFVAAMKTNDIAVEHISDNTKQISTYINKNWDEVEAVKVQEENATADYHADREVPMNRV